MTQMCSRIYKRKGYDIIVERNSVSGMLLLSTIVDNQLITHRFFDYTVKESLDLFLSYIESQS